MDIMKRLREGRTEGTDLRWQVSDIHIEAANEIERLHKMIDALLYSMSCDDYEVQKQVAADAKDSLYKR